MKPASAAAAAPAPPPCAIDRSFAIDGNRVRVIADGPARLEALLRLIDGARRELRLLYYIFSPDAAGSRVRDALVAAVGRGVRVAMVVDGFGSDADDAFFAPLRDAGAQVCRFLPRFGRRYLLRNHQKLALADDDRAVVGGFNVSDDYFADGSAAWRDLGLELCGPAAGRLAGYFDALQGWARQPNARMRELRQALKAGSESAGGMRWLLGGPTRRLSPWALAMKQDMRTATRLDMVAAYFFPNPAMLRRIERIAARGEARVVTAANSDNNATIAAARHTYARLLRRGVRLFEYQPTKLHTKLFVVDDAVYVGSANFDIRSLYLNLEMMLRIESAEFADAMRDYCTGERAQSTEITRESHAARGGLLDRIRWSMAYFMLAVVDASVTRRLNFGVDGN